MLACLVVSWIDLKVVTIFSIPKKSSFICCSSFQAASTNFFNSRSVWVLIKGFLILLKMLSNRSTLAYSIVYQRLESVVNVSNSNHEIADEVYNIVCFFDGFGHLILNWRYKFNIFQINLSAESVGWSTFSFRIFFKPKSFIKPISV